MEREQRSPMAIEIGNLVMTENFVRTSAHASACSVVKGVPEMDVSFCFGAKLNHFRGNQRSCSSTKIDYSFLSST